MEVNPTNTTKEWRDEWRRWIESFSDITHFQMHRSGLTNVLNDVDALVAERDALAERVARLEQALMRIASYDEGPDVTGSFDEPCAARIARDALVPIPEAAR